MPDTGCLQRGKKGEIEGRAASKGKEWQISGGGGSSECLGTASNEMVAQSFEEVGLEGVGGMSCTGSESDHADTESGRYINIATQHR
jgi:hypothetical protein